MYAYTRIYEHIFCNASIELIREYRVKLQSSQQGGMDVFVVLGTFT